MRALFVVMCWTISAAGCTWQDTLSEIGTTPEYLRLTAAHEIVHAPRWRLAADARVRVVAATPAPQHWTDAAGAGVSRVFANDAGETGFVLEVQWPAAAAAAQARSAASADGSRAGLFGFVEMPGLPKTGELPVSLRAANGRHLHRLALRIKPELWGKAWSEPKHIEAAFSHLAAHLRGG